MTVGCRSGTDDDYSSIVLYARRYVPDASPSRGRCPNCTGTSATKGIIIGNRVGQQGARRSGQVSDVVVDARRRFDWGMLPPEWSMTRIVAVRFCSVGRSPAKQGWSFIRESSDEAPRS